MEGFIAPRENIKVSEPETKITRAVSRSREKRKAWGRGGAVESSLSPMNRSRDPTDFCEVSVPKALGRPPSAEAARIG